MPGSGDCRASSWMTRAPADWRGRMPSGRRARAVTWTPEAERSAAKSRTRSHVPARPAPLVEGLEQPAAVRRRGEEQDRAVAGHGRAVLEADLGHVQLQRPGQDRLKLDPGERPPA